MIIIALGIVLSLFQGCISSELEVPTCRILYDKYDRYNLASRHYLSTKEERWPKGTVYYVISKEYSAKYVKLLKSAMRAIEDVSCVKWVPRKNERHYVYINPEKKGCFAHLGFSSRRGKHNLNLQLPDGKSTCMSKGIAIHEMLHVLGAGHEQSRPDRDRYIKIHWNNMNRDKYSNFFKSIGPKDPKMPVCNYLKRMDFNKCYSGFRTNTFGLPYDYQSLMHYGLTDFTITGRRTMTPRRQVPYGIKIGQRAGMTRLDIKKLDAAYSCNEKPDPIPPTRRTTKAPFTYGPTPPRCWDEFPEWCDEHSGYCLVGWLYMKDNCQLSCGYCNQ